MSETALDQPSPTCAAGAPAARRADPSRETLIRSRFAATGIDLILLYAGACLLGQLGWIFAALPVGLFLMRDWGDGYSPGKRFFNLVAHGAGGRRCTLRASILRNVTLLPPLAFLELALLLFSRRGLRPGDLLSVTSVQFRETPAPARPGEDAERTADPEPPAEVEPTSSAPQSESLAGGECEAAAVEASDADSFEPEIIDPGLLTPESLTDDELEEAAVAAPGDQTGNAGGAPRSQAPATAITGDLAARCIGIEGGVTHESLDDAYWHYVDRYSPDAAQKLNDDELYSRCAELASAKSGLPLSAPRLPAEEAARSACLQYLNDWFVIINKCRDALG